MTTQRPIPGAAETSAAEADQVPIRLPNGEQAWVSAHAFNLIGEKAFHDSQRLRQLRIQRNLAFAIAGAILVVSATGIAAWLTRPPSSSARVVASEGSPAELGPAEPEAVAPQVPRPPNDRDVEQAVLAWAQAWSDQDVEAVLAFYSPSFLVPDGMRRLTWERLRRERIENPELLGIAIEDLVAERTGPETAMARFIQIYDTPGYRAWVIKTLQLTADSDRWLIVDELASLAEFGPGHGAPPTVD